MPSLSPFLFPFFLCVYSKAQASDQLFPNMSSINVSNFSYIVPYGQRQDCDIFGPICQTGSITVGVNLTTTATSTILPCSSYLSAQSAYLVNENEKEWGPGAPRWTGVNDYLSRYSDLADWNTQFGQSPECRSYANAMRQGRYTISDCGSSNTVIQTDRGVNFDYPPQLPPGVVRQFDTFYTDTCCGNCSLEIREVKIYYFPDQTATKCKDIQASNVTSNSSSHIPKNLVHSLAANGNTAVISGYTLQVQTSKEGIS